MDVTKLLELSIERHASDLHILPDSRPLLRIDGVLGEIKEAPLFSAAETKNLIYSIMSVEQQQSFETNISANKLRQFSGEHFTSNERCCCGISGDSGESADV
jgi:Tfp pilus assembly pilus retraction ATPase PilT